MLPPMAAVPSSTDSRIRQRFFLLMLIDKEKARKNRWRIPESTLIMTAVLGGSIGALAGMYLFRHKTKHLKFTLGVPAILVIQVFLGGYIAYLLL